MRLDMTITLGNVIQIGAMVAAIVIAYTKLRERLIVIETQTRPIVQWWNERAAEGHRREGTD